MQAACQPARRIKRAHCSCKSAAQPWTRTLTGWVMAHYSGSGRPMQSRAPLQQDQQAAALVVLLSTRCWSALDAHLGPAVPQDDVPPQRLGHVPSHVQPHHLPQGGLWGQRVPCLHRRVTMRLAHAEVQAAVSLWAHPHAAQASTTCGARHWGRQASQDVLTAMQRGQLQRAAHGPVQ